MLQLYMKPFQSGNTVITFHILVLRSQSNLLQRYTIIWLCSYPDIYRHIHMMFDVNYLLKCHIAGKSVKTWQTSLKQHIHIQKYHFVCSIFLFSLWIYYDYTVCLYKRIFLSLPLFAQLQLIQFIVLHKKFYTHDGDYFFLCLVFLSPARW